MHLLMILLSTVAISLAQKCTLGGQIYARGLDQSDEYTVLNAHNNYRLDIANDRVPGQQRGIDLKRMKYDRILAQKAQVVSNSCKMEHIDITDTRWHRVGQNLYIQWSSAYNIRPDWNTVVKGWFDEHQYFTYPNISRNVTGHYTQVVWASTDTLGCDFIAFYDVTKPKYPYARLYTCNYGPSGNYIGQAPYKIGGIGCTNLC